MVFINPPSFLSPTYSVVKERTYTAGAVVIESDDGGIGDYTHWLPLIRQLSDVYSPWRPSRAVVACPDVNTGTIGDIGKMTVSQLQELQNKYGWEIMSHGKWHHGIGEHTVKSEAAAGQKRIDIDFAGMVHVIPGYTYRIWKGTTEEVVAIIEVSATGSYDDGYVTTAENLVNTYPAYSKFQLTEASALLELQGCIDDLESWGLTSKNYVYPYHSGVGVATSLIAQGWCNNIFDSSRGNSGKNNLVGCNVDTLAAYSTIMSQGDLEDALDAVISVDGVFIFYGHSGTNIETLNYIRTIVQTAIAKGMRIMTRQDAIKRLIS